MSEVKREISEKKDRAYLYVYYIDERTDEIYVLVNQGRSYHLNALVKLSDYLSKITPDEYWLTYFGTFGDVYAYRKEECNPEIPEKPEKGEEDSSEEYKKIKIIYRIAKIIFGIASISDETLKKENFNLLKFPGFYKYFRGILNNPWTSVFGGEIDNKDKNAKAAAIREFIEEIDGATISRDLKNKDFKHDKERNKLFETIYNKAQKNVDSFESVEDWAHLFHLKMKKDEVETIKKRFSPGKVLKESLEDYSGLTEIGLEKEDISEVFDKRIKNYKKVGRAIMLEKRSLDIWTLDEFQNYYQDFKKSQKGETIKEHGYYRLDEKYMSESLTSLVKFFKKLFDLCKKRLNEEVGKIGYNKNSKIKLMEKIKLENFARELEGNELMETQINNLDKVFKKHFYSYLEKGFDTVKQELDNFKEHVETNYIEWNFFKQPSHQENIEWCGDENRRKGYALEPWEPGK
ncbi:MAG: hypothetical protein QM752_07325 [Gammaproteobacteria bacterium]